MTTPEEALRVAEAFVAAERPGCRVKRLDEDASDYFVVLELEPGQVWRVGEAFIFISKQTGNLWQAAPGEGVDKIADMLGV